MNDNAKNIDDYLSGLPDWQQANLRLFQMLIHEVRPAVSEDIKWGVPVFVLNGKTAFAMSSFKAHTKYNFIANGALLNDSKTLFNNGLESKKSRGLDLKQGETVDQAALKDLIKQAISML